MARVLVAFAVAAGPALLVAGCSSSSSGPGLFPAVLEAPAPREDTPLSPDQVKQATDNLISERNRLCAEATADASANGTSSSCGGQTAGGAAKP